MSTEVDIFVRVLQKGADRKGLAVVLYRYKGIIRECYFSTLERTQFRSIIRASIIAIEGLSKECNINLYTQSNFGFAYMDNSKKWINRDMGEKLYEALVWGGHAIKYIDCSTTEEGKDYQQALAGRLRPYKNSNTK